MQLLPDGSFISNSMKYVIIFLLLFFVFPVIAGLAVVFIPCFYVYRIFDSFCQIFIKEPDFKPKNKTSKLNEISKVYSKFQEIKKAI